MKTPRTYELRRNCICQHTKFGHEIGSTNGECRVGYCECQRFIPDKWWTRIVFRRLVTRFAMDYGIEQDPAARRHAP